MAGLNCEKCGCEKSMVVDSRPCNNGIRRRRECEKCGSRWTTYEFTGKTLKSMKTKAAKVAAKEEIKKAWAAIH